MGLWRVEKVSVVLDVPKARVYELIRAGVIPSVRLGRQIRVDEDQLREWIARGGTPHEPPPEA
jgi:excisionase family DNA binding protein